MPSPIVVIGSINMDLVCRTPRIPRPGETITGSDFLTIPGGKGANQAVAASKLGADVHMIARVGDDDFGDRLLTGLSHHNVNTKYVTVTEGVSTGVATILVDRKGENSIVLAPGANHKLTPRDIDKAEQLIASASAVILQLEIPIATVQHAIALCQRRKVFTILDPAPVPMDSPFPRALYGVDLFTPNQSEAESLLDQRPRSHRIKSKKVMDANQIAADLLSRGPKAVILKLGPKGAMLVTRDGKMERIRGHKIKVVDTTAAGDAFTAALAVAHAEGLSLSDSIHFANAAGALTCQSFGAQPSLPTRAAVDKLIA